MKSHLENQNENEISYWTGFILRKEMCKQNEESIDVKSETF